MLGELKTFEGARVQRVVRREYDWSIQFDRSFQLIIQCHWRLLRDSYIYVTDEDHGKAFGRRGTVDAEHELRTAIVDRTVSDYSFLGGTSDLELQFGHHYRLQLISNSSGLEAWQLAGPNELLIVAQGGADVGNWLEARPVSKLQTQ